MRILLTGIALLGAMGCGAAATSPDAGALLVAPDTAVLAIGDEATVDGVLVVRLVDVPRDSRCPIDVVCIWAGNAEVVLSTLMAGVERAFTLNTLEHAALGPRSVTVDGYRITLIRLTPTPRSDASIPPAEYRATLEIVQT